MHGNRDVIPVLNETNCHVVNVAMPGDYLHCDVELLRQDRRTFTFYGLVCTQNGKRIATVSFTGTSVPKKIFDRRR